MRFTRTHRALSLRLYKTYTISLEKDFTTIEEVDMGLQEHNVEDLYE